MPKVLYLVIRTPLLSRANVTGKTGGRRGGTDASMKPIGLIEQVVAEAKDVGQTGASVDTREAARIDRWPD